MAYLELLKHLLHILEAVPVISIFSTWALYVYCAFHSLMMETAFYDGDGACIWIRKGGGGWSKFNERVFLMTMTGRQKNKEVRNGKIRKMFPFFQNTSSLLLLSPLSFFSLLVGVRSLMKGTLLLHEIYADDDVDIGLDVKLYLVMNEWFYE